MEKYRYILNPGTKKDHCPGCNKKRFVRYIDTETGEYLPIDFGRCDREQKCGYFLDPYTSGYAKEVWEKEQGKTGNISKNWRPKKQAPKPQPETVYFDFETFRETLRGYEVNTFLQNLLTRVPFPFEAVEVTKAIELYRLGTITNGYRKGAVCFPFIDKAGNVRTIQTKNFDETNHTTATDFLHSILKKYYTRNNKPLPSWLDAYLKQDRRVTCLFGEHLLNKHSLNPVALVEAPKTAIYGALYFGLPVEVEDFIWLAVYNKSSFSFERVKALQSRTVYIFPDLSKDGGTFREWSDKAKEFENRLPGTKFIVSDLLEQIAPEIDRLKGNDLADFLIKMDWRQFREKKPEPQPDPMQEITPVEVEGYDPTFDEWLKEALAYERRITEREAWISRMNFN